MKAEKSKIESLKSESGFSLISILIVMSIFAIALLAVAPTVQIEVQREKELEAVRRGEEVAEAIRQYLNYYNGAKYPDSMDELLEGLPDGTKKRMILRPSAAIDPLSEDGKWKLVPINKMATFTRRVQNFNNGVLPSSDNIPRNVLNQLGQLVTSVDLNSEDDVEKPASETDEDSFATENTQFVGVVSQSESKSVIRYYGIGNHSKWVFTPFFRGSGSNNNMMLNNVNRPSSNTTRDPVRPSTTEPEL